MMRPGEIGPDRGKEAEQRAAGRVPRQGSRATPDT